MADDFSEFGGFQDGGGTAVAPAPVSAAPDEFAEFGGQQLVAAPDPATQGQQYLNGVSSGATPLPATPQMLEKGADGIYRTSALGRDARAIGGALFGNTATTPDYQSDESGFEQGLRQVPLAGPLLANIGHGIGNLVSSGYDTVQAAKDTATADRLQNGPVLATAHLAGAAALGIPGAIYQTVNPFANLIEKGTTGIVTDAMRAAGYGDAAANLEARQDFNRLQYQQDYERPAQQAILSASPNPAVTEATQNIAPLLIPGGVGLETAGINAKLGGLVGDAAEGIIAGPVGGAGSAMLTHHIPLGSFVNRGIVQPIVKAVAPSIGGTVGDLTTLGLNAATPVLTGAVLGAGSADPGQETDAARAGAAQGALFSPVTALHGAFARQDMEQSALAKQAAVRGMAEYGNNPDLDNATARGIASLDPASQQAIFQQRGLFRGIQNPEGKQIQIHVPDDYDARAQAANGGAVDDAAGSRGFYLDGKGGVYVNPAAADTAGALSEALGHELGHSVYQDALPGVSERAASRLTNAVTGMALDDNLQPTPDFQSFINQYATAAGDGTPATVDWSKLPVSGPGLTRNYLLNELGAETVRAAAPDVGAQLAGPELSDKLGNFASDLATRLGLKAAPNAAAILGADGQPVPISVPALQAARTGSYAIGQQAADSFGSPVRIAPPDPVPKVPVAKPVKTPPVSTTPYRDTPAYKDAFTKLTLSKKFGGQGVSPSDARTLLDRAALDTTVPDTSADYVDYVNKAVVPDAPAPAVAPAQAQPPAQTTAASPDLSFRETDPYKEALAIATQNPKNFGFGMKHADAMALLDRAAQDPSVPNTNVDYLGYIKKATTPAPQAPTPAQPILASAQPNVPESSVPILAPAVPIESATAMPLAPVVRRATVPPAIPNEPTLAPPAPEPVNRFADLRPEPATDPRDAAEVSNPPPSSPPQSTPQTSASPATASGASEAPKPGAEQTLAGRTQSQAATRENPSERSTAVAAQNPVPLTKADMERIEAETEANFKPAPYNPRGTPEEKAAKIAARNASDLEDAKDQAVADAHAAALEPGDTRVQMRVNPDTGKRTLSGTHFVDDDPFHQRLIGGDTEAATRANLPEVQDAIRNGSLLNYDYDSAAETRTQQSAQQRRESQAASSASDRATGVGNAQLQNKSLRPFSVSPNADGSVSVNGFSPEKMLGNAEVVMDAMRANGLSDRLPYADTNDPAFVADVQSYIENHANGYKGDGSGRLTPVEGVNVPDATPGYQPTELPPARAHLMNIIMGQDQTLGKPALKSGDETTSGKLRRFAAANDNPPSESGEVNPLRDELNRKGLLKAGPDEGSRDLLHSVFETNRADLMSNFRDPTLPVDFTAQRGASFRGDRTQLAPGGKTPNSQFSGSGFLPARQAGASTPAEIADAARQWQEKGTDSPYFQKWFGGSKVVTPSGRPLVVYHRTGASFEAFDTERGDLGSHFGNAKQAAARQNGLLGDRTIPVYLSIEHPLQLVDKGGFHADSVAPQLLKMGIIDASTSKRLAAIGDQGSVKERRAANTEIKGILAKEGFDGIVYKNKHEGAGNSYIAFDPSQIKHANENTGAFDRQSHRIND